MWSLQRDTGARLLAATVPNVLRTPAGWRAVPAACVALLLVALTAVAFAALTLAPDATALQRRHPWRWWWRSSDKEGSICKGVPISHGPKPTGRWCLVRELAELGRFALTMRPRDAVSPSLMSMHRIVADSVADRSGRGALATPPRPVARM